MKRIERLLMKLIIIHFVLLLLSQFILLQWRSFAEIQKITYYEGVNKQVGPETLDVFQKKK
ncbi:MAG TPA: DUF5359 family protein [Chondromyces sp.]|nr:DUF5359 family protein [Chondromyces sp.]